MASTHIKLFVQAQNGHLTDMANAGKRGKTCRVLFFFDVTPDVIDYLCTTHEQRAARGEAYALESRPLNEIRNESFDVLAGDLRALAATNPGMRLAEETIRGVDAPKPVLTAGTPGVWEGSADETGISLSALNDVNQWREITFKQQPAKAYELARKVWDEVRNAPTVHQAAGILTAAGCKLHGYCGMD